MSAPAIGQIWDDNQLRDIRSHRAPRHIQNRNRRVTLTVLAVLALASACATNHEEHEP